MLQVCRKLSHIAPQLLLKPLEVLLKVHIDVKMLDHVALGAPEAYGRQRDLCTSARIASHTEDVFCETMRA